MALVDYVSSDEDENEDITDADPIRIPRLPSSMRKELKRKRDSESVQPPELPPLPSKFHDLYTSKVRIGIKDDPSFHDGRKRIIPHVEGNWPSHIYIEWHPPTAEHELLTSLIASIKDAAARLGEIEVVSLLISDLGSPLPLHISLSRPIVFTTVEKDSFLDALYASISGCGVRPFKLEVESLQWVSNSEKTRWFLTIQIRLPEGDELNRLLKLCNDVVEDYSQPPLYAAPRTEIQHFRCAKARAKRGDPKNKGASSRDEKQFDFSSAFHISIAWALEQPSSNLMDATKIITNGTNLESFKKTCIQVDVVKVKVGNLVSSIALLSKNPEEENVYLGFK